jgi:glutamyl-Q tRNA(Asp) synthetase
MQQLNTIPSNIAYRGRFAPTPSGALHFGSLIAALGSYLDARAHQGFWHLRIEDVDPPRVVPGSIENILRTLEAFGFMWDGAVVYQSQRRAVYASAIQRLLDADQLYGCHCTRKRLKENACIGVDGPIYRGTCRDRALAKHLNASHPNTNPPNRADNVALRVRVPTQRIQFIDLLAGHVACDIAQECGDFVLQRADGIYTYQLAVTVDDAELGVTHVVRGADLLASTPRQIILQRLLGYATPTYLHLPVVLNSNGEKLSKQTLATPLNTANPLPDLLNAAAFLGLNLSDEFTSITEFWQHAPQLWQHKRLPPLRGMRLNRC